MTAEPTPSPSESDTYARFLPDIIVESVADGRMLDKAGAETFACAVMFADISGFTPLTARYAADPDAGPEKLTAVLNDYFTDLVRIVAEHGGDVLKFAGDAVLAIWRDGPDDHDLAYAGWRAAQCGIAIQATLRDYQVGPDRLSLRVAIGAGEARIVHVGGVFGRWEFLFAGKPLEQVSQVGDLIEPGTIGVSERIHALLTEHAPAAPEVTPLTDGVFQLEGIAPLELNRKPVDAAVLSEHGPRLRGYIPAAVARRIDAGQGDWIGELRNLTVVFVNLPDIDYRASVDVAQQIMVALQESCYRFEGSINKLSVDDKGVSLLAALGLPPLAHEDDPDRGLRVAITILESLSAIDIRCSIGVSTGRVYCGVVGAPERREYTIMGNAVNLAARLMQRADGGILCDDRTFTHASRGIAFGIPQTLQLKGRSEPDQVHSPRHIVDDTSNETAAPIVGREPERALLAAQLGALVDGTSAVVTIEADAGYGKTRLLQDLLESAAAAPVTIYSAAADAIERSTPHFIIRALLLQALDTAGDADAGTGTDKDADTGTAQPVTLAARLDALFPEPELRNLLPLLSSFLPLELAETAFTEQISGQARAAQTSRLTAEILRRTSNGAPLLIAIDDMHWLDAASAGVLPHLQQALAPLLLVMTMRPVRDPAQEIEQLQAVASASRLHLERMAHDEICELVCARLGVAELPVAVATLIGERADGLPYYGEELASALLDSGVISVRAGQCELVGDVSLADEQIPHSIEGVITSRIDRLTPEQALTIKIASVIGRNFSLQQLHDLHPADVDMELLSAELEEFERLHLTPREGSGENSGYVFKQVITQKVAHSLLLKDQSRGLHARLAEQYEVVGGQPHALLAHHWELAGESEQAFTYLVRAVDEALAEFANQDAVLLSNRALALAERFDAPAGQRGHLLSGRGRALFALGRPNEGADSLAQALRIFGEPMPTSLGMLALGIVWQSLRRWGFARASKLPTPSREEAARLVEAADAYSDLQVIYYYRSDDPRTMYAALRGSNVGCASGQVPPSLVRMNANLCVVTGLIPARRMADWFIELADRQATQVDHAPTRAWVEIVAATYMSGTGEWQPALAHFQKALTICEELGDESTRGTMLTALSKMLLIMGHYAEALAGFESYYQQAKSRNAPQAICWSVLGQARVHLRRDELYLVPGLLDEAEPLLDRLPFNQRMDHLSMTAIMSIESGDTEGAEAAIDAACALLARPSQVMMIFAANHLCYALLELARRAADARPGAEPTARSRKHFKRLMRFMNAYATVYPPGEAPWLYQRGQWAALLGREEEARGLWRGALAAAERFAVQDVYLAAAERLAQSGEAAGDPELLAVARELTGVEGICRPY